MATGHISSTVIHHKMVAAIKGTADHLRNDHGLPEEMIDSEDISGMTADHLHLHGIGVMNVDDTEKLYELKDGE